MCWEEFSMILVFAITLMVLATNRYFMYGSDRLQEDKKLPETLKVLNIAGNALICGAESGL